ncbi:MAG: hypothetical protein OXE50_03320 [Chloroflexi bacterium]|nr:hypothetical protein [Chloroflexota bacterium]
MLENIAWSFSLLRTTYRTSEIARAHAYILNNRDYDISPVNARIIWRNEDLDEVHRDSATSERIRSKMSEEACRSDFLLSDDLQGQECAVVLEVEVAGNWVPVHNATFRVEDVGSRTIN